MKVIARLSTLLLLAALFFTACKKPVPQQARFVPKKASFVALVNGETLKGKLEKSQDDIEALLKNMSVDNDTALDKGKKEWEDLKNSGLDLGGQFFMWVLQQGGANGPAGNNITGVVGKVKDADKLQAYVLKKLPGTSVQKEKDYSYVTTKNEDIIAWSNDIVMALNHERSSPAMQYDSLTGEYSMQTPVPGNVAADLKAQMTTCFTQKESESVADIPEFRDLAQEKSDAYFWINPADALANIPLPLPRLQELTQNNYTAATLQFEDGKVVVNTKSYTSKPLTDILKKFNSREVDMSLVEKYPSSNINGFTVVAFDPQMLNALVQYMQVGGMVDGFLTRFMGTNYTLAELLSAFKGDMAFVVSDFREDAMGGMYKRPTAEVLFTMPVANKAQLDKLLNRLVANNMLVNDNGIYRPAEVPESFGFSMVANDKNVIIASDKQLLSNYAAGKGKANLKAGVMDDLKGKAGVFYLDLEGLLTTLSSSTSDFTQPGQNPMAYSKETFKDVKAYANNFNGKYTEGHLELRMKDEKTNSLSTLIKLAAKTSAASAQNRRQGAPAAEPDSTY